MEETDGGIMPVEIAKKSGFCFGVKRAINMAEETLNNSSNRDKPIYILGEIIHNPQTVEMLKNKGAISITIDQLEKVKPGKLILRSHGEPLEIIEKSKKLGFEIINTVCPFVNKALEVASLYAKSNHKIIIIGKKEHPEVKSLLSHTLYSATVIGSTEMTKDLNISIKDKVVIIVQTTFSGSLFKNILGEIVLLSGETKVYNTICNATYSRRSQAISVAKKVDLNIIVGGKNSSNTRELTKLLIENGYMAHQIERADELDERLFSGIDKVGITGGASTPIWVIEEVKNKIEIILNKNNVGI